MWHAQSDRERDDFHFKKEREIKKKKAIRNKAEQVMLKSNKLKNFSGGPVAKTLFPMQGGWVWSLVRELDPACQN